jgi:hypothetical protein
MLRALQMLRFVLAANVEFMLGQSLLSFIFVLIVASQQ